MGNRHTWASSYLITSFAAVTLLHQPSASISFASRAVIPSLLLLLLFGVNCLLTLELLIV